MIPQTHVPEPDRQGVVAYIKTFSPRFNEETPEAPLTIPEAPARSAGLIRKGRQVYDAAQCWSATAGPAEAMVHRPASSRTTREIRFAPRT
jgi:hypothetical protein